MSANSLGEILFNSYLTIQEIQTLKHGDFIDHRDDVGRFALATIVDSVPSNLNLKIHYVGWNDKWDTWCSYVNEPHRFAKPRSISRRPRHRLMDIKIGSHIDINSLKHPGWRIGQVRRLDVNSGQLQVVYPFAAQNMLWWIHFDNITEIDAFGTHIKPCEKLDHLSIWLKTRHTLSNVSKNIKNESLQEIIQISFGGISNMYDFMVEHAQPTQLQSMQEIIKNNKMKAEELKKNKKQNSDIPIDIDINSHDSNVLSISSMSELPKHTIAYMSSFLDKEGVKSLKLTCYKNCMACLQEMKKYHIGILNTNIIINDKNKQYIDMIGLAQHDLVSFIRHTSVTTYSDLLKLYKDIYKIPIKSQILYNPSNWSVYCPKLNENVAYISLTNREFYLFDKRHTIFYDTTNDLFKIMNVNDNGFQKQLLVLKFFDIFFQQIYTLQFMITDMQMLTIERLSKYIQNEFIVTTEYQQTWKKRFSSYLQEMSQFSPNQSLLNVVQEVSNVVAEISDDELQTSGVEFGTIIVFQLNVNHPLFAKSKFTNMQEKYQLLS